MDRTDPNYPIPFRKLSEHGYPGKTAYHYMQVQRGLLTVTKMGRRTFVLKRDADAWLSNLPKVGHAGEIALQAAKQAVEALGRAVAEGHVDQKVAALTMRDVALTSGLNRVAA